MPRLGSRFFDAYNKQTDRLRTRRKENAEAFNSFVKMRAEQGEEATVAELERLKQNLGGGDAYFFSAMPSSEAIAETSQRLGEIAQDKVVQEQTRVIGLQNDELNLVKSTISGLVDVDVNTPEGMKKVEDAFTKQGQGNLFQEYAPMIGNIHNEARTNALTAWKNSTGFNSITTEDGKQAALTTAPSWGKGILDAQGTAQINAFNNQRVRDVKADIDRDLMNIASQAGGDENAFKRAITQRVTNLLGPLATSDVINSIVESSLASFQMQRSGQRNTALQTVTASDADLLATRSNPDKLRQLAITALATAGYTNPDEATIQEAMRSLVVQRDSAEQVNFETKVQSAVGIAENLNDTQLSVIDTDKEIDDAAQRILVTQFDDYGDLSDDQKAEALARISSIIRAKAKMVNDKESEDAIKKTNSEIDASDEIKNIASMGPVADRKENIYGAINDIRANNGLPQLTTEQLEQEYGDRVNRILQVGASQRYATELKTATDTATAHVDAMLSGQKALMERIAGGEMPDGLKAVVDILDQGFVAPNQAAYTALSNQLAAMAQDDPPQTMQEQIDMANKLAAALGFLPKGTAKTTLVSKALEGKNLIRPGTDANAWVESENKSLDVAVNQVVNAIELQPMFSTNPTGLRDERLEILRDARAEALRDLDDEDVMSLLSGDKSLLAQQINDAYDAAEARILQAVPKGKPPFLTRQGNGTFVVTSSGGQFDDQIRAAGFKAGEIYRRDENGQFVKVMDAPVTPTVPGIPQVGTPGTLNTPGVTQINPTSSGFTQDIQGILAESDLIAGLNNVQTSIATGSDGGPASSPFARTWNYFFGDPSSAAARQARADLSTWLQSDQARQALLADPGSFTFMQEDPLNWALSRGFMPQQ